LVASRLFVVVGMSFECAVDRFLFEALKRVQHNLQVGESVWIVVNPSVSSLKDTYSKLLNALPAAEVCTRAMNFGHWVDTKMPDLIHRGVLTP